MGVDRTEINRITGQVIAGAIEVHRILGPGLLESAYEACLVHELTKQNLRFERRKPLLVRYKEVFVDCAYRLDLLVEKEVIVELKSVACLASVHEAQLMSYLRLSGCRIGLLINFNVRQLTTGIRRFVNNL